MPAIVDSPAHERFAQNLAAAMPRETAFLLAGLGTVSESVEQAAGAAARQSRIRRRVREILEPKLRKNEISVERLLEEYARLAFSNLDDVLSVDEAGQPYFDYASMTRAQRAALAEVTIEEEWEGRGDDRRLVRRTRFKMHDKRAAMSDLAKYLKMWAPESVNVNVSLFAQIGPSDKEALLAALSAMIAPEKRAALQIEGEVVT